MILEAAKSIAAATSALVKAASAAQRELVDTGKVNGRSFFDFSFCSLGALTWTSFVSS